MCRLSASKYIREHDLCKGVGRVSGIYAITINQKIVYIGKAKNMESRTRCHIRNVINGYITPKYGLLLAALKKNNRVDCKEIKRCGENGLCDIEKLYINKYCLPLNRMMTNPSMNPKDLSLEQLLTFVRHPIVGKRKKTLRRPTLSKLNINQKDKIANLCMLTWENKLKPKTY